MEETDGVNKITLDSAINSLAEGTIETFLHNGDSKQPTEIYLGIVSKLKT